MQAVGLTRSREAAKPRNAVFCFRWWVVGGQASGGRESAVGSRCVARAFQPEHFPLRLGCLVIAALGRALCRR
ncbi:MAG: hypothetical protein ACKON9_30375, partial [Planctomycetaceae bacterium]